MGSTKVPLQCMYFQAQRSVVSSMQLLSCTETETLRRTATYALVRPRAKAAIASFYRNRAKAAAQLQTQMQRCAYTSISGTKDLATGAIA